MTNPISGGFQFTPATGLNDTVTYPTTPVNETAARQQVMDLYWQLMNEMNLPTLSAAAYAQYNNLINGNFDVWQRGTSFTNPTANAYTTDRWKTIVSSTGTLPTTITHSRQPLGSGDIPNSFYFYRINVNGAGSGFGVNDVYEIAQPIENGTRFLCGTGKKVTISFDARSDIPNKKIGVRLIAGYGTGGSTSDITNGNKFTLTSTWTRYSITFTTNTIAGKTFGVDDQLNFDIGLMWGSTRAAQFGDTVAETFGGVGNVDIAQVQVNAGDQALPFQPRSFAEELARCQRYFEKSYDYAVAPQTANSLGIENKYTGTTAAISQPYGKVSFKVKKRTTPTVTIYPYTTPSNTGRVSGNDGTDLAASSGTTNYVGTDGFTVYNGSGGTLSPSSGAVIFHYAADSEL